MGDPQTAGGRGRQTTADAGRQTPINYNITFYGCKKKLTRINFSTVVADRQQFDPTVIIAISYYL